MATPLYDVVEWVKTNGEVKAIDRLKVAILPDLLAENLLLSNVGPDQTCSGPLLQKIKDQASTIVGKPCPIN